MSQNDYEELWRFQFIFFTYLNISNIKIYKIYNSYIMVYYKFVHCSFILSS